jgi:hypothetical protein
MVGRLPVIGISQYGDGKFDLWVLTTGELFMKTHLTLEQGCGQLRRLRPPILHGRWHILNLGVIEPSPSALRSAHV